MRCPHRLHWDRATLLHSRSLQILAVVELHSALQDFANGSPLFDTAVAVSAHSGLPSHIGRFEPDAAALLGIEGITLLAMRPDGYVGLRSDREHLAALERYSALVKTGNA